MMDSSVHFNVVEVASISDLIQVLSVRQLDTWLNKSTLRKV